MERPAMCVPTQVYSCAPVCLSLWEGRAPLALSVGSTARWAAASSSATALQVLCASAPGSSVHRQPLPLCSRRKVTGSPHETPLGRKSCLCGGAASNRRQSWPAPCPGLPHVCTGSERPPPIVQKCKCEQRSVWGPSEHGRPGAPVLITSVPARGCR